VGAEVSAAAVPAVPAVWCPLMPGEDVEVTSGELVAVAPVACGVDPEDKEGPF
jgi:hypothetical protein